MDFAKPSDPIATRNGDLVSLAEIIGRLLTNPFQFNWSDFVKPWECNTFAIENYRKTVKLVLHDKFHPDELCELANLEDHLQKIIHKEYDGDGEENFVETPNFYVDGLHMKRLATILEVNVQDWNATIDLIEKNCADHLLSTVRTQNARKFAKRAHDVAFFVQGSVEQMASFLHIAPLFPTVFLQVGENWVLPCGFFTFRKIFQVSYEKLFRDDPNVHLKMRGLYIATANELVVNLLKNDASLTIYEAPIIKINGENSESINVLVQRKGKVVGFSHQGPPSRWIKDNMLFQTLFPKHLQKVAALQEMMKTSGFVAELSGGKTVQFAPQDVDIFFTSFNDWKNDIQSPLPLLTLSHLVDALLSFRLDNSAGFWLLMDDFANFKEGSQSYFHSTFSDHKHTFFGALHTKGEKIPWYNQLFQNLEPNYGTDLNEPLFDLSRKQLMTWMMINNFATATKRYSILSNFLNRKVLGFSSLIPLDKYEEFLRTGFSSDEANSYFEPRLAEFEQYITRELSPEESALVWNLRLLRFDDKKALEILAPTYE